MTPNIRTRFNAAKLLQTDINAWKDCTHQLCRERQSCLGGPRGICARTNGWPACTQESKERMKEAKIQWHRTEAYENETAAERSLRRIEAEMLQIDIMMKAQGV